MHSWGRPCTWWCGAFRVSRGRCPTSAAGQGSWRAGSQSSPRPLGERSSEGTPTKGARDRTRTGPLPRRPASAGIRLSRARPPHDVMVAFTGEARDLCQVKACCRRLNGMGWVFLASHGGRAAKPPPTCARGLRDENVMEAVQRIHTENHTVHGARRIRHIVARADWHNGRGGGRPPQGRRRPAGLRCVRKPVATRPAGQPRTRPDGVERMLRAPQRTSWRSLTAST